MQDIKSTVLHCLQQLKGSGKFASIHSDSFLFPGLKVEGVGEVAFPVNELQAKALIKAAHKAPFGKGSHTIVDNTVRSGWEIDAGNLSFSNKKWDHFLNKVLKQLQTDMGLEDYTIDARPYKLLVYEEGDFFLPHKDSEKEKGMFGTLIIGLPSSYTGGELEISFEGQKEVADFAKGEDKYSINYAAFYADCEHEVKPVTSGYRICLAYNLVQEKAAPKIEHQSVASHSEKLAETFTNDEETNNTQPYIILLGHQYTPENFSEEGLKLNDRARAQTLLQAAKQAGLYSKMCLVTSYLTGSPAFDGFHDYSYGEYGGDDEAEMDEVFDSSLKIEHWLDNELPSLDHVTFEEDELMTSFPLDEDEPIIKESTGYMGNWGPDINHWYHYGAVMLWSPEVNAQLLLSQNTDTQLQWIDYFNDIGEVSIVEEEAVAHILKTGFSKKSHRVGTSDFNAAAQWLINRNQPKFLASLNPERLSFFFCEIDVAHWITLFEWLPKEETKRIFKKVCSEITLPVLEKLLALITVMAKEESLKPIAGEQVEQLPLLFDNLYDNNTKLLSAGALKDLFHIACKFSPGKSWIKSITAAISESSKRPYIHNTLAPQLLLTEDSSELTSGLFNFCKQFLQERADNKPQSPADWSRPVPNTQYHKKEWNLLKPFLESPDQQVFDYRKRKADRKEMEAAIKQVTIDLKMETIKKGSPHLLKITKTRAAYKRRLRAWQKDVALLEKLVAEEDG